MLIFSFSSQESVVFFPCIHLGGGYDAFFSKRMLRVLPPYIIFASICWFIIDIIPGKGIIQFFADLTLYSFWNNGEELFWYVAAIILLYIIFPLIYWSMFRRNEPCFLAFYLWMITILGVNAYLKNFIPATYENIEIATSRIPVFLCGTLVGYYVYFKKNFPYSFYITCFLFVLGSCYICSNKYLPILGFRYTYLVIGISFSVVFAFLFDIVRSQIVHKIFRFLGGISLELYIVHIALRTFFYKSSFYVDDCFKEYLFLLCIAVFSSYFLDRISTTIKNKIFEVK